MENSDLEFNKNVVEVDGGRKPLRNKRIITSNSTRRALSLSCPHVTRLIDRIQRKRYCDGRDITMDDAETFRHHCYSQQKKVDQDKFILKYLKPEYPKRKRHNIPLLKGRSVSIKYFVRKRNGDILPVCATLFRNITELKANILGPSDLYVKSGSDINLVCKVSQGPHELGNIFWYKGNEIIDTTTNLNEIDSTHRITVENEWVEGLTSRLKIRGASPSDTGNYTCVPTMAKSSSVYVHVIIGEHPAAMQHNSAFKSIARTSTGFLGVLLLVCYQAIIVQFLNANNVQPFTNNYDMVR